MSALPNDLTSALDGVLTRFPRPVLGRSVERLIGHYREGTPPARPILGSDVDVAAYACYRMPATYAAVRSVFDQVSTVAPGFAPRTHVDVGGGTGADVWAAADAWPSLADVTVLEQSAPAIALGRRLAESAASTAVRRSTWTHGVIDTSVDSPAADLITLSYVLGELAERDRADVVRWLSRRTGMLVIIEPGTPAGYERIAAARDLLRDLGLRLVAPCPHEGACPIPRGRDWCHFSARLPRSSAHRHLKDGALSFEDEKFSYIVASPHDWRRAAGRVLRHPRKPRGQVALRLCSDDGTLADVTVSRRQGARYRAARDVRWGGEWPPADDDLIDLD
ncbi:ribosomal protein RSM22 (predicted rRNA methylase) [Actinoalloteichus hoggarensis]|uniref:Mitochondrial small ribosomal subunit Rsm22 n=1 Tax=Actinoalloteichus hoggarensis TaxID=1470176 RepID=A0A221W3W5_9PSEU|nr:small ribosomal subunit Rsm22 family protein [Actinoalloteichus hoggarensis]ASO20331.1 Mitochondrial small ribosomal subunit Rsm22 [Actinoalloteichus hoggarensis]MBB5923369.1 ribosomal protein RSM22 (predicted rRNA methylase) [Actinoalloteichus hoggarensis]